MKVIQEIIRTMAVLGLITAGCLWFALAAVDSGHLLVGLLVVSILAYLITQRSVLGRICQYLYLSACHYLAAWHCSSVGAWPLQLETWVVVTV